MSEPSSVLSIVVAVALFGLLGTFILLPLLRGGEARIDSDPGDLKEEDAKKKALLFALRDVEYDFATGKLDDRDYQSLKSELAHEALAVMETPEAAEAALASEALEAEIRRVREGLREGTTCRRCGRVNDSGSQFCSRCGFAVSPA